MMAHQRQLIRQAVRALLLNQTAALAKIETTRVTRYRKSELPAIAVYTSEEMVAEASSTTAPRELTRELDVVIAGWVGFGDGMDDAMDDLALEIETAMHADPYLGGLAGDSILKASTMAVDGEGDALMGFLTLTYGVTYRTLAPEAQTNLANFHTVDARHRIVGITDPTQDGEDNFIVEAP